MGCDPGTSGSEIRSDVYIDEERVGGKVERQGGQFGVSGMQCRGREPSKVEEGGTIVGVGINVY